MHICNVFLCGYFVTDHAEAASYCIIIQTLNFTGYVCEIKCIDNYWYQSLINMPQHPHPIIYLLYSYPSIKPCSKVHWYKPSKWISFTFLNWWSIKLLIVMIFTVYCNVMHECVYFDTTFAPNKWPLRSAFYLTLRSCYTPNTLGTHGLNFQSGTDYDDWSTKKFDADIM